MAKLARALESIQDHVSTRLLFPKSFTGDQAIAILNAARTLTGNPITADWNEFRVVRDTDLDTIDVLFEPGDEADLRLVRDIEIEIDDRKLVVGKEMALMRGVVKEFSSDLAVFGPSRENPKATLVRFDGDVDDGRVHARAIHDESARTPE
ncbi:hypothetical protein FXW78_22440 [Rhodococcus opacus]|nr:hypothetical protein [Rhodococcus opacus]